MNGGASGGPVFTQFANGKWYVVGVNNLGSDGSEVARALAWNYWTSSVGTFFCDVAPTICR
jgi:hypothetical protein